MKKAFALLTKGQLATRWNCSERKIDRMRTYGVLSWIDLSGGEGNRPTVRFSVSSIEEFEKQNLMSINTTEQ